MSDTANPAKLASAEDFDARLRRSDEARWLATRYAPDGVRERLVAFYLLNQELQRALHAREAMLGKIRLQWWRETLKQIASSAPLRRHDLAEELARVLDGRADLLAPVNLLLDVYDEVLDDHLQSGGHAHSGGHEARHLAVDAALVRLAGRALSGTASAADLDILAELGAARLALAAGLAEGSERWQAARSAAHRLPTELWPAILHYAAGTGKGPLTPLGVRWRVFWAAVTRRLP